MTKCAWATILATSLLLVSTTGAARTTRETTYRYQQIWSSAVRFLRVDNGFEIKEQDKETGYVLFAYPNAGRSLTGSVELIPMVRRGSKYISVALRIQDMPSYVEVVLIDKLVRKLRNEYGEPPLAEKVKPALKPKDEKAKPKDDSEDAPKETDANDSTGKPKEE